MKNFNTGDKVICTDDRFGPLPDAYMELPKEGETYTVEEVREGEDISKTRGVDSVVLSELTNGVDHLNREVGFAHWRFEPLDEDSDSNKREERELVPVGAPVSVPDHSPLTSFP